MREERSMQAFKHIIKVARKNSNLHDLTNTIEVIGGRMAWTDQVILATAPAPEGLPDGQYAAKDFFSPEKRKARRAGDIKFPNWTNVEDSFENTSRDQFAVPACEVERTARQCNPLQVKKAIPARLSIEESQYTVSLESPLGGYKGWAPIKHGGHHGMLPMWVDPYYLERWAKKLPADCVVFFSAQGPKKPLMLQAHGETLFISPCAPPI